MYTEYVFENKKYEVAARDIKATLFDIVSTEEGKISDLREKAFVETNNPQVAQELQSLYVQQDGLLREVLAASDNLYKTLEKVDTCSRKLKQIENKNLAQIVATIHGDVNEMSQEAVQQQVANNEISSPEPVVEVSEEPVVEKQQVQDEGDSLAAASAETPAEDNKIYANDNNSFYMEGDDIVLVPNEKPEEKTEEEQQQAADSGQPQEAQVVNDATTTAPEGDKQEVVYPEENKIYADDNSSFFVDGDDIVLVPNEKPEEKTEEEQQQAADGVQPQSKEAPVAPEMVATEAVADANEPVMTPVPETVEEPVMTSVAEEVTDTNTSPAVENAESGPVITPVSEEQPVLVPAEAESSGPLIQPVQEESTGLPLPVINPDASTISLTLKKRSADQPKVIMISGAQASKLRASLETQEALLSAKGLFQSAGEAVASDSLEQQLVNNGLLEPDATAVQAQIEQMMEQANALYSAGQVEEAQNMYNQISALNKELQGESAGITK